VNPRNINPRAGGFYLGLKDGLGVLLPSEIGYSSKIGGRLSGVYKAGFFYSNADHADVLLDVDGGIRRLTGRPALIRRHQWAVFGNIRQQITLPRADGSGGLSAFFNGTWAGRGTPTVESKFAVGLNYSGPLRIRPTDEIGFGVGTGRLNDRLTDLQRNLNAAGLEAAPVRSAEYTAELYYGIDVRSGLVIRPNVQFTVNPSGNPDLKPLVVYGLKVVTAL
jgi:porin